jgi:L-alanine-DL-glutamate epimerase-like enolase superfamily enzyme
MIIRQLDIWRLRLAFLSPIKHNLADHRGTENLVVKVTPDGLPPGYGEGVPRAFVTGETVAVSLPYLTDTLGPAILGQEFANSSQLLETLSDLFHRTDGAQHPGAFCALETALLDAAGRTWDLPLHAFLGPLGPGKLVYSAVIPMVDSEQLTALLHLVKKNRMAFLKLKVGTADDLETLRRVREFVGWEVDIRVDANCAWGAAEAVRRLEQMRPFRISAVEQPVAKDDFAGLKAVSAAAGIPVIADESLCTASDAQRLIDLQACQIFNIRLSKCGGPLAASRIRQMAAAAGMSCQLGCHVGETSILTAAGRHFAACGPPLVYLEGAFSPYLFSREPVAHPLVFGPGGAPPALAGPGLGIEVLENVLHDLAVEHLHLEA